MIILGFDPQVQPLPNQTLMYLQVRSFLKSGSDREMLYFTGENCMQFDR